VIGPGQEAARWSMGAVQGKILEDQAGVGVSSMGRFVPDEEIARNSFLLLFYHILAHAKRG
jgi:hypothetical protein